MADMLGCSYWSLLEQVKSGTCPVMPIALGHKYRWPTASVLRLLGVDAVETGPEGPARTPTPTAATTDRDGRNAQTRSVTGEWVSAPDPRRHQQDGRQA